MHAPKDRLTTQKADFVTPIKSFLFVPGDSEKKLSKAPDYGAEALIFDLEDSVAPDRKEIARQLTSTCLSQSPQGQRSCQFWVRINPVDSGLSKEDLLAILAGHPDGIVLPKSNGPEDIQSLSAQLDDLESKFDRQTPPSQILAIATETAKSPFNLGRYADFDLPRLYGLTWGAEDLSAALGANTNRGADGNYAFTYQLVRSLCLLGAHAAGVHAVEGVFTNFRDTDGLSQTAKTAFSEGFSGQMAIHPHQVPILNSQYTPSEQAIEHAKQVIEAFEKATSGGVASLNGKMLDAPHLQQAKNTLSKLD